MTTGNILFETLGTLQLKLTHMKRRIVAESLRSSRDVEFHDRFFDVVLRQHAHDLDGHPALSEFPAQFGRRIAEADLRVNAARESVDRISSSRQLIVSRMQDCRSGGHVDETSLEAYRLLAHSIGKSAADLRWKKALFANYEKRAAEMRDLATRLEDKRRSNLFGFFFDNTSAAMLASTREAIEEWEDFLAKSRGMVASRERTDNSLKSSLEQLLGRSEIDIPEMDHAQKGDAAALELADRNLESALMEKAEAEEELMLLQASRFRQQSAFVREALESGALCLDEVLAPGTPVDAISAIRRAVTGCSEARAAKLDLAEDLGKVEVAIRDCTNAMRAIIARGWTRTSSPFPHVTHEDLRNLGVTRQSLDVSDFLKGVVATAMSNAPVRRGEDRADIVDRPPHGFVQF